MRALFPCWSSRLWARRRLLSRFASPYESRGARGGSGRSQVGPVADAARPCARRWSAAVRPVHGLARAQVVVAVLEPGDLDRRRQARRPRPRRAVPNGSRRALADQRRRARAPRGGRCAAGRAGRAGGTGSRGRRGRRRAGGVQLVGDHAGDAAAHRLAADDEPARRGRARRRRRGTRPSASRRAAAAARRPVAAAGHVAELEAGDAQPGRRRAPAAIDCIAGESIAAPAPWASSSVVGGVLGAVERGSPRHAVRPPARVMST